MKRIESLMRLKRFRIEEVRRQLETLEAMHADVERKLADLEDSVERERSRSGDSDIGRLAFPTFLRSIETRRENLNNTLQEIARERDVARGNLEAAEQELKSFEFATEQQAKRAQEMQTRRAQNRTDAVALERHLRKHATRQL